MGRALPLCHLPNAAFETRSRCLLAAHAFCRHQHHITAHYALALDFLADEATAVVPQARDSILVPARRVLGRLARHAPRAAPS